MSGIIEGYKHDIYLSFCQKDNRGDRWVSDFAEALRTEIESTFKEEITLYFNENPPATGDTTSTEGLNCLVFIPLISLTYCDQRSFIWINEFKSFIEEASKDRFGLKIKLPDGRQVRRVLPVLIYELEKTDIKLCESVLGGELKGINFCYREPGVNRPLTPRDKSEINLNGINYRNQINKIANSVKDIIDALKSDSHHSHKTGTDEAPDIHKKIPSYTGKTHLQEKSVAVLPFVNMSPEKDQDYFCDGMAEEIIHALAHNDDLRVISRTSAFAFKDRQEDAREIGRKLGVGSLLEGSFRKSGNRIRIGAQLIKVDDGTQIWSDQYDREAKDVFEIQDEISLAILKNLKIKLLGEKKASVSKLHSENIEAYNLYLKGTYYWQLLTAEGYKTAAECFEQALREDPNYATAYIGLSYVTGYRTVWGDVPPNIGFPKIKENVDKVLKIDSTSADAYSGLAGLNVYYFWNWKEAERNFKLAIQLNPNSSQIHLDYSNLLTFTGRHDEAIVEAKLAQVLDPFSIYINTYTGFAFDYAGQYDKAIEVYQRTLAINPNYAITHYHLGRAYFGKGMIKEAVAEYEKAVLLSGEAPLPMSVLASSYYLLGKKTQADEILEKMKKKAATGYVPATTIYLIYRIRGEEKSAMAWLKKACDEHDTMLPWFRAHPLLIPEGSEYKKLLNKSGLGN